MRLRSATVCLLAVLLASAPAARAQQIIAVLVDGATLELDVPPVQIAGRVLVPIRGIFERLGARVDFDAASQVVTAMRERTTVILRLGSREARVNDRFVTLDVPALALRGRAMVPLRFLSEALGARVEWEESTRTIRIFTGSGMGPGTLGTRIIEGTLLRVEPALRRIQVLQGSLLHVITVTAETAILRRESTTGVGGSVNIRELRPGDQVAVAANDRLEASTVRAVYREVRGVVESIALRTMTLRGGESYPLHLDLIVSGRVVAREDLRAGMPVILRLNPVSGIVWEITVE